MRLNQAIVWLLLLCVAVGSSSSKIHADEQLDRILAIQQQRVDTIAKARAASVAIFSSDGRGGGSGVLVSPDGYAVTNFHVVRPCGPFMKCGLDDGNVYDAVIVGIDATGDVALIKLHGRDDFPTAPLADSNKVRLGEACFAIGNPFLLATNMTPTVTWGVVSGVHRYQEPADTLLEYTDCIQTDASINPGNSGGPLFNAKGEVIGINGRISLEKRGRVNVGVGYAISSNQVKYFMGHLKSGRLVDHATLGATVVTATDGRVIVDTVLQTSDAFRRGLRFDDEIVSFGDRRIDTPNGFKNVLGIYPKGWRVPLQFRNDGKTVTRQIRLAGLHPGDELIDLVQGGGQARPTPEPKEDEPAPEGEEQAADDEEDTSGVPKALRDQYIARRGYANYYFNLEHQNRLLNQFESDENSNAGEATWKIQASTGEGRLIELALGPDTAAYRSEDDIQLLDFESDLADQRFPQGSGGLLLAAYHWHRLVNGQARKVGEVTYIGKSPRDSLIQLDDVLSATMQSVVSEFYFDSSTGMMTRLETFGDISVDPCVIEFGDYREVDGRLLPMEWTVWKGDQAYETLKIQSYGQPSINGTQQP